MEHDDYVNELQLRLLFDEVKPALGEAISTFYHRMMKGDDGKVDTPFSNVILNENERAERRMVVKQLREQKNHLQKLTTLMSMLDVASTVQEWKIAEEANDKLIWRTFWSGPTWTLSFGRTNLQIGGSVTKFHGSLDTLVSSRWTRRSTLCAGARSEVPQHAAEERPG